MKLLFFLYSALLAEFSSALTHKLVINSDERDIFKIETFGFVTGGMINISVSDFHLLETKKLGSNASSSNPNVRIGFIMRKSSSESLAQQDIESTIETGSCILDHPSKDDFLIDLSDPGTWKHTSRGHTIPVGAAGLYTLIFARCKPIGEYHSNFKLYASFRNPGPNYLSAGDTPLPIVYITFSGIFFLVFIVWMIILNQPRTANATGPAKVHRIHYMMAALLLLKSLTLLFESIRYHYISLVGTSNLIEIWSILFYTFALLKGIMLFTVILLIGSGWSLMKGYLLDREKQIIFVVLCLQVLDNIAMIILEETAPGSQRWATWKDVLHFVDIICCCAILFPIVWSIRHLRLAAEADGKAQHNLVKLQLFRQFYVMVVAYIYFTRIVVFLLSATIPFYLLWLGPLFTELATLLFFVVTGLKFRPASDNPYLRVRDSDLDEDDDSGSRTGLGEDDEYGLRGEDGAGGPGGAGVQMTETGGGGGGGSISRHFIHKDNLNDV